MQKQQTYRCAVYTRKSTDERLDMAFNSLDAQYEACAAYVKSQQGRGWTLIDKRYDDGGYSGGNLRRPALSELLKDIESGMVDIVVVYKIDRLSRSLTDFGDISRTFENHGVSFVSVTQQIDTSSASGRMMQNILMSFAQFEREISADRVRDKLYQSRKLGLWTGGPTPYGYRIEDKKLVVDAEAAEIVRKVFRRYIATASCLQVARELNDAGVKRPEVAGKAGDGVPVLWNSSHIWTILRNRVYTGKLVVKRTGESFDGVHERLVDDDLFEKAQRLLDDNRRAEAKGKRHSVLSPLKGLLRCGTCGGAMTPVFSNYKGAKNRRYIYYRCTRDAKQGEHTCPIRNIAADVVEKFVYSQLGPVLRRDDVVKMVSGGDDAKAEAYLAEIADLDKFWSKMVPAEKERLIHLLVKEVRLWPNKVEICLTLNGGADKVSVAVKLATNLGRQTFVVDCGNAVDGDETNPETAVEQTIRRSHKWLELLTSGTYHDRKSLAEALGLSNSYLGRILRFPFLSPIVVQKIMDGELPDISVTKLMANPSLLWSEQHRLLGID